MFQIPIYLLKNLSVIIMKLVCLRKQKYQWQEASDDKGEKYFTSK